MTLYTVTAINAAIRGFEPWTTVFTTKQGVIEFINKFHTAIPDDYKSDWEITIDSGEPDDEDYLETLKHFYEEEERL